MQVKPAICSHALNSLVVLHTVGLAHEAREQEIAIVIPHAHLTTMLEARPCRRRRDELDVRDDMVDHLIGVVHHVKRCGGVFALCDQKPVR